MNRSFLTGLALVSAAALLPLAAAAQFDDAPADSLAAAADSLAAEEEMSAIDRAMRQAQQNPQAAATTTPDPGGPFFRSFTNKPQVGTKANVRQYNYYWELATDLRMRDGSGFWFLTEVQRDFPDLLRKTVILTGDPDHHEVERLVAQTGCPVVGKPVELPELLELLDEINRRD